MSKKIAFSLLLLLPFLFLLPLSVESKGLDTAKDSAAYNASLMQVDELLMKVELVSTTLDSINKITKNGFDTREIETELPRINNYLKIINDNLVQYSIVLNVKNVQMFQVLLQDIKTDLDTWRTALFKYSKELAKMKTEMSNFAQDSTAKIIEKDTLFRHLYLNELNDVKDKWKKARHFTTANLLRITRLQANVSKAYFLTIELQETVTERLREFRRRNWGKEFIPLFSIVSQSQSSVNKELVKKSYEGQRQILGYYIERNWYNQVFIVITAIAFFLWIFFNYRAVVSAGQQQQLTDCKFKYINAFPLQASLVLVLNIAPFLDLTPPSAYVEMTQFLLMVALTILFIRNWPRNLVYYWVFIIVLYVLFALTNAAITPGVTIRLCLLLLNIISVLFGILFAWRLRKKLALPAFVQGIIVIYIVLNAMSAIANIYGRVSLAKVLSMAAIFGLTQIIGLSVFIHIITEAFFLQMIKSRVGGGIDARLDYDKIMKGLDKFLSVIMIALWLIVFSTNLGMYSPLYSTITTFLTTTRNFGNISFSFSNVFLFFAILYISNLAQKYIAHFFGEPGDDFIPNKKSTRLVILRLILLIIGFLLAISASGLPVDRITIVLGALGVGIGLGLQNIVNNLVSGIILIFESPFRIGDSIEVGNKKGRVKDIGIRSSRLITMDGSEIIVPNGDFLSGQVINWSVNDETVRSEILIKIEPEHFAAAKDHIIKAVKSSNRIVKRMEPIISISNITGAFVEVKIQFWISNIRKEQELKSEIFMNIYKALTENNIKIV